MPSVDSALASAFSSITRTRMGPDQPFGGRATTLTVHLEFGRAMRSFAALGITCSKTTMADLLSRGNELLWDIRAFTPTGPERDLPPGLDVESGMSAPRTLSTPGDSFAQAAHRAELEGAIDALEHHGHSGHMDKAMLHEAREMLRSAGRSSVSKPNFVWGDEKGSLWNSIAVRPMVAPRGGRVEFEAYSDNYYSGFVNDGFDHGLMPILRFQKGDELMKRKFKKYATIDVRQLGQGYPIWSVYNQMGGGDSNDTLTAGFSYFGDQLTPGAGVVDFADRTGDAKHEEGVHMFEKGFEVWLGRALPNWQREFERRTTIAFDQGKVVKGGALRNVKGSKGGTGGRFTTHIKTF